MKSWRRHKVRRGAERTRVAGWFVEVQQEEAAMCYCQQESMDGSIVPEIAVDKRYTVEQIVHVQKKQRLMMTIRNHEKIFAKQMTWSSQQMLT